jgi:hypothetical protein
LFAAFSAAADDKCRVKIKSFPMGLVENANQDAMMRSMPNDNEGTKVICNLEDIQQVAKKKLSLSLYEYIASG